MTLHVSGSFLVVILVLLFFIAVMVGVCVYCCQIRPEKNIFLKKEARDRHKAERERKEGNGQVVPSKQDSEMGDAPESPNVQETPLGDDEDGLCKICMESPIDSVLVPCGHICVCMSCSQHINEQCPICRGDVKSVVKTFTT